MKNIIKTFPLLILPLIIFSCSSIKVAADYDKDAKFNSYKTFAFFKTGIDKAEINDLDKRRILRAIETALLAKGFTKSETPDLLVSIFTKSRQRVNIYNNSWNYWGGFNPYWSWNQPNITTNTEGYLYIDLIDNSKKELVWQGTGTGYLSKNTQKKDAQIKEFVTAIMEKYPPKK